MFLRRMALRHMAYGKPEASATLRSLGWALRERKLRVAASALLGEGPDLHPRTA